MTDRIKDLFQPIAPPDKRHPHFEKVRAWPGSEPGRIMVNEVFQNFSIRDGNFVEQFQTTGFDTRIFELYLHAYLSSAGFEFIVGHDRPDFIVKKDGLTVAIEATTVNPTQGTEEISENGPRKPLNPEEALAKNKDELPIRFGGPLFTKLGMKYWELDYCKGIPLVFAIEAFHERDSLQYTSSAISQYVFGLRWRRPDDITKTAKDSVVYDKVETHQVGQKQIPSNFFGQPGAEHISAVIFTNSGTFPKFERMGYHAGYHRGNVMMRRRGTCYNPDPASLIPLIFDYSLDEPPVEETWGQGMVILLNPNALHPIPKDFFPGVTQQYVTAKGIAADVPGFQPFSSVTDIILIEDDGLRPREETGKRVGAILKSDFEKLGGQRTPMAELYGEEKEWFTDRDHNILGTVIRDKIDDDWLYVILGRDGERVFRAIENEINFKSRTLARAALMTAMERLVESGKTVFSQGG